MDTAKVAAVGQAGGVLLTGTVQAAGLDVGLSAGLGRWRKPLAVHDPGKVVMDLAVSLALGGDALSDVAVLRAEPGVYGLVASDPTISRTIAALAGDADAVLTLTPPGRRPGRGCGGWLVSTPPDHQATAKAPLVIDLDATLVTAHFREGERGADVQAGVRAPPVVLVPRPRPGRHG